MTNEQQPTQPTQPHKPMPTMSAPSEAPQAAPSMATSAAPPTRAGTMGVLNKPRQKVWPTVIGVIGIIFGIGGILLGLLQALMPFMFEFFRDFMDKNMPANSGPNPFAHLAEWGPMMALFGLAASGVAIWLLIASIGLARRKSWSKPALIGWSVAKILFVIASSIFGYYMGMAISEQVAADVAASANPPPTLPTGATPILAMIQGVINLLIYGAFPVFLLIWLNLKGPRQEVARWRESPPNPTAPP